MSGQKVRKCKNNPPFRNTCDISMTAGHNRILQSEGMDVWCLSLLYLTYTLSITKGMIAEDILLYYEENLKGKCHKQKDGEIIGHWNSLKNSLKNSPVSLYPWILNKLTLGLSLILGP